MSIIKVAGKQFKLASRWARLGAFLLDVGFLGVCQALLLLLSGFVLFPFFDRFNFDNASDMTTVIFGTLSFILWGVGLFFMDGFKQGGGFGKKLLSLQIVRLEDGEPANFKDAFVRRFAGIFQPVDWLFATRKERQRMGDKFAKTVVVKLDAKPVEFVEAETETDGKAITKTADLEKILADVIGEITNRFSEARQKVDASIGIEKQFQDAYEGAIVQAERCEERAIIAIQAGREDLAREDLAQRNDYQQLANNYKTQWEEQRQAVTHLTTLFETLQQKTEETERKRDQVIAQHTNINTHDYLREALTELQDSKAFEILKKMEQNITEAAALAKAASEVDVEFKDVKLHREFASYAEDASIDKDLAELKARVQ